MTAAVIILAAAIGANVGLGLWLGAMARLGNPSSEHPTPYRPTGIVVAFRRGLLVDRRV